MPNYQIEKLVDSLATISDILYMRLHCMECNQCEPCGPIFMEALNTLREAGNVKAATNEAGQARGSR